VLARFAQIAFGLRLVALGDQSLNFVLSVNCDANILLRMAGGNQPIYKFSQHVGWHFNVE
jgi:hypothetical protein